MIYRTWLFALLVLCWLPGCLFDPAGLPYSASNNNNGNSNANDNSNTNTNTNTNDVVCGDDQQESPEVCDGADLGGQSCQTQGYDGGTLTCLESCAGFDTSACTGTGPECGDGQVEGTEVCDGSALGGRTCQDEGFYGGDLACQSNCTGFDTAGCVGTCGDEIINGTEVCDATALGGRTCQDEGFYGGLLGCLNDCTGYNLAGCLGTCGDDIINGTEVCDGTALSGRTCVDEGFYTGNLACLGSCAGYDTAGCSGICGDDIINGTEVCDGIALSGRTCVDEGFYTGDLACLGSCAGYDTSSCSGYCGNGVIDGTEECDGSNLGGLTCASLGCRSGTTTCNTDCTINTTSCYLNHDEDGDGVDDNCDNCPTYPNASQADSDNDEVGGVCEAPFDGTLLSQITAFESLMTAGNVWNVYGGTWTLGTDEIVGTAVPGGGNYVHQTVVPNVDYSVEAMFYMSVATSMDPNWTAVVFAWRTPGGNLSAYECVYERGPNIISIFRTQSGPWNGIVGKSVATTVTASQWRRLRVYRYGDNVRCAYDDEAGGADFVEVSGADVWGDMSGRAGLRVYNESAIFTSFVIYQ